MGGITRADNSWSWGNTTTYHDVIRVYGEGHVIRGFAAYAREYSYGYVSDTADGSVWSGTLLGGDYGDVNESYQQAKKFIDAARYKHCPDSVHRCIASRFDMWQRTRLPGDDTGSWITLGNYVR